jgi:hypothetical protein
MEAVMGWITAVVALGLVMTVLTVAELRQSAKGNTIKLTDLSVGDHVIAAFVLFTSTIALIYGLVLLLH